eukprot:TRINITY_DN2028_c1_g3_i4.p1 TRINITY_DN2028_c1_g3~~TRINITY_DN2028_c1_g3_i4.p1  ORF type:complete len:311 (+),score=60.07 TRINITY_DN2028_c1_g3_i4:65-997(+)
MRATTVLKAVFLITMWGICLYFIIRLTTDYAQTGSKPSTKTESVQVDAMEAPWVLLVGDVGDKGCFYGMSGCVFVPWGSDDSEYVSCVDAIKIQEKVSKLNRTTLRHLDVNFANPYDTISLHVSLLTINEANQTVTTTFDACGLDRASMDDPIFIPIGDQAVLDAIEAGQLVDAKTAGIPTIFGPGQQGQLTFTLTQEQYLNGTVRNTTEFGTTQYPKYNLEDIEVRIHPGSFVVQRVVHTKGQSVIDLMGSVFGWIGVLTGACMYSIFSSLIDFLEEDHKKVVRQIDKLGQYVPKQDDASEAVVHEPVS